MFIGIYVLQICFHSYIFHKHIKIINKLYTRSVSPKISRKILSEVDRHRLQESDAQLLSLSTSNPNWVGPEMANKNHVMIFLQHMEVSKVRRVTLASSSRHG